MLPLASVNPTDPKAKCNAWRDWLLVPNPILLPEEKKKKNRISPQSKLEAHNKSDLHNLALLQSLDSIDKSARSPGPGLFGCFLPAHNHHVPQLTPQQGGGYDDALCHKFSAGDGTYLCRLHGAEAKIHDFDLQQGIKSKQ